MDELILYAWGRPLNQDEFPIMSQLDHTWVTNYPEKVDPDQQPDPPPGWEPPESYWYCWGAAHNIASHFLGSANGNVDVANNVSLFNVIAIPEGAPHYTPSKISGAIVYYGLDGVCHQVANEILCATGTPTREPIRVQLARGYSLSTFFFGTYGINTPEWDSIQKQCAPDILLPGDDFIPIMKKSVPENLHSGLLGMREVAREQLGKLRDRIDADYNFYPELVAITTTTLGAVRLILGSTVFDELFPAFDFDDEVWLRPTEQ